jgi:hypothetical protein
MLSINLILSLLLLLSLGSTHVHQLPYARKAAEPSRMQQDQRARECKFLELLDKAINESRGLRLHENKAWAQNLAADLLFPCDADRARALFREAADNTNAILDGVAVDDDQYIYLANIQERIRREILQLAARHEPELARHLASDFTLAADLYSTSRSAPRESRADEFEPSPITPLADTTSRAEQPSITSTDDEASDELSKAIAEAKTAQDFESVRRTGSARIRDPERRRDFLNDLYYEELLSVARAGNVGRARELFALLHMGATQRAKLLAQLARVTITKDKRAALGLIREAAELVGDKPRNMQQLRAKLQVACVLLILDTQSGASMLRSVVDTINDLAQAAVRADPFLADGFNDTRLTRGDEFILESVMGIWLNEDTSDSYPFTLQEINRFKEAIDGLLPSELKVAAYILMARSMA